MKYGWILLFWVLHVTAHLCLKFGSTAASRWWPSFIVGNVFGVAGTLVLMKTYTGMNANVALALCVGGGFLLAQTTIFVTFRSSLSSSQIVGILAITLGMTLVAMKGSNIEQSPGTYSNEAADGLTGNAQE
ncbi:MAG: hypothetical protein HQ559_12410 [Lentisphaerae bacterium]|nr:hypothetical protein [Lentisphaerota bacterium]